MAKRKRRTTKRKRNPSNIHAVLLKALGSEGHYKGSHTDRRGHPVHAWFSHDSSRYPFDSVLSRRKGWQQYDTNQDAWYFGAWVNPETKETVTYAEGDLYYSSYPTLKAYNQAIKDMDKFYGE